MTNDFPASSLAACRTGLGQTQIGRNRRSIECKHHTISAALRALEEDWVPGYRPARNDQTTLEDEPGQLRPPTNDRASSR